jgi:hypothetical protein
MGVIIHEKYLGEKLPRIDAFVGCLGDEEIGDLLPSAVA